MRKQKGFIGIIAMLIVIVIAALWMVYLFKNNWFGAPDISGGANSSRETVAPKDVPAQLDDLRANMKNIANQKDREIENAVNEK
jgi:hypothetical protein